MKAIFERKPSELNLREVDVAKTIRLPAEVFEEILKAPLRDYDFIKEHADLMCCDSEGVYHCLLLTGEDRNDGLLVEAEGSNYCRYASYVPDATALTSPSLRLLNRTLSAVADRIVAIGTEKTADGLCEIDYEKLEEEFNLDFDCEDITLNAIEHLLMERREVAEAVAYNGVFHVGFHPEYCPHYDGAQVKPLDPVPPPPVPITLWSMIQSPWEDVHLMHKDVEVEPCTIVELNERTLTEAGREAWADVLNAEVVKIYTGYYGLQMELDKVKPRRLEEFSSMLAGYCPVSDYEKWVNEAGDAPARSPEMKM